MEASDPESKDQLNRNENSEKDGITSSSDNNEASDNLDDEVLNGDNKNEESKTTEDEDNDNTDQPLNQEEQPREEEPTQDKVVNEKDESSDGNSSDTSSDSCEEDYSEEKKCQLEDKSGKEKSDSEELEDNKSNKDEKEVEIIDSEGNESESTKEPDSADEGPEQNINDEKNKPYEEESYANNEDETENGEEHKTVSNEEPKLEHPSEFVDDPIDTSKEEEQPLENTSIPHDTTIPEQNQEDESDFSSEEEDISSPVVIKQTPNSEDKSDDLAESLKKALEEREKQKQLEQPIDFRENSLDLPSDFDDTSIRARRAEDFESRPPLLPPKLKPKSQNLAVKRTPTPPNIFHVKDKNATLGRGMWSEDEENEAPPSSYQSISSSHPPPDRVIDFTQGTSAPQRSNSKPREPKHSENYGPPSRIIDVNSPYDGPNDAYRRQALVSLPPTRFDDDADLYDSVPEESIGDLSKLIQEANSLDINAPNDRKQEEPVNVLYPSYQRTLPAQMKLSNAYPDAFAKLATSRPESPKEPETKDFEDDIAFSAVPRGPLQEFPARNPRAPRKRGKSEEDPLKDPQDGDDEISIAESDFRINNSPMEEAKNVDASEYLCEVYPSDYTDFETASETDIQNTSMNPLHNDITPYDTVAAETDWDMPKPVDDVDLNPIVNEDYQICTDLGNNRNTFPRRIKEGKPKAKERVSLNMVAVALTDPSAGPSSRYTTSNNEANQLRRPKSNPNLGPKSKSLIVKNPHIVVTRGPTHPDGYEADYSLYQPSSLPTFEENRPKKKKKNVKADNDARQIHLSLSPTSNSDTDNTVVAAPNNLQINVLPSSDPNIINLNIRTTEPPVQPSAPVLPTEEEIVEEPIATPLQLQPIVPMTAISHRESLPNAPAEDVVPQHRVVDVAPVLINTQPVIPDPEPMMSMNQPVVQPTQPYQQPTYIQESIEPVIVPQQEIAVMSAPPPIESIVVMTQPQPLERHQSMPQPVNNVVVEIENPWQDTRKQSHGLRHGGDSGIDLTNYENKKGSSDSSDDSTHYEVKRQSSKRKLADADQLRNGLDEDYMEWYKNKYMKPSHLYLCLKHFIFIVNLIFLLVGLGLVGLGTWGFVDMYMNGLSDPSLILFDPIFPVFVLGILITLAASQGAVGFLRDNICMIKFFAWCLIFYCLIFVAGGICFWVIMETVTTFTTDHFTNWITNYNDTSRKASAFTINQMQLQFGCCGISDSNDWLKSSEYECSKAIEDCSLPSSCCNGQNGCSMLSGAYQYEGCINVMTVWVKDKTPILIGVWLGIILLFILEFVCVYFMIREIRYLRLIRKKISSVCNPDYCSDDSTLTSSSDDSEYEERRRRRKRKRKRANRKKRNYYVNKGYN